MYRASCTVYYPDQQMHIVYINIKLLLLLLLLLLTAIESSVGGSSSYTSTNKNKHT